LQGSENGRVVTIDFWLCLFLRNSQRKSGVGKMNGSVITNRLQNSFKIKDNNVCIRGYLQGSENGRVVTIEPEMIGDLLICIFKMAAQREFGF
jgi:hypothetical protein